MDCCHQRKKQRSSALTKQPQQAMSRPTSCNIIQRHFPPEKALPLNSALSKHSMRRARKCQSSFGTTCPVGLTETWGVTNQG